MNDPNNNIKNLNQISDGGIENEYGNPIDNIFYNNVATNKENININKEISIISQPNSGKQFINFIYTIYI